MAKAVTGAIDWAAAIAQHPVLAAVPAALRGVARLHIVACGQVLARRGERPRGMWCVLAGEVRLLRNSQYGVETILQRTRGGFIAEASLDARAYHCDLRASEPGRLLRFPIADFRRALDDDPAFRQAWMAQLAREVRALRGRCERLSLKGAAQRILHYIEAEGSGGAIMLTQSRKAWARELGLTHEVLYRTLRQLREDGILTLDADRIALKS